MKRNAYNSLLRISFGRGITLNTITEVLMNRILYHYNSCSDSLLSHHISTAVIWRYVLTQHELHLNGMTPCVLVPVLFSLGEISVACPFSCCNIIFIYGINFSSLVWLLLAADFWNSEFSWIVSPLKSFLFVVVNFNLYCWVCVCFLLKLTHFLSLRQSYKFRIVQINLFAETLLLAVV